MTKLDSKSTPSHYSNLRPWTH